MNKKFKLTDYHIVYIAVGVVLTGFVLFCTVGGGSARASERQRFAAQMVYPTEHGVFSAMRDIYHIENPDGYVAGIWEYMDSTYPAEVIESGRLEFDTDVSESLGVDHKGYVYVDVDYDDDGIPVTQSLSFSMCCFSTDGNEDAEYICETVDKYLGVNLRAKFVKSRLKFRNRDWAISSGSDGVDFVLSSHVDDDGNEHIHVTCDVIETTLKSRADDNSYGVGMQYYMWNFFRSSLF